MNATAAERIRLPAAAPPAASRGVVLLEALVAITIFMVGVLGVLALQAKMVTSTSASKYRADAAFLATEIIGQMWSDVPNMAKYDVSQCSGYALCSGWTTKVASRLPQGAARVTVAGNQVTVTVSWTPPNSVASNYTTISTIQL
jgi:type IV pilus assembly protein PilV